MTTTEPMTAIAPSGLGRLYRGQTAIDFVGRRRAALVISLILLVVTAASLGLRGLDLGIDFRGGISWDIPSSELSVADAEAVLAANGVDPSSARVQQRSSDSGDFIKVQIAGLSQESEAALQSAFADAAGVGFDDVSVNIVSASWGSEITAKALRALAVFTLVAAIVIAIRFEWRMSLAAIIAMLHDVIISVGIYAVLGFVVSPATVIAFLTILGYSLYDTIVIFDRIRENEARFETANIPYADVINVSMNQVLVRTLMTTLSSMLPVLSILVVGAGILGASALSEFAIALLVGMIVGAYSSIFVAAPLLLWFRSGDDRWRGTVADRVTGEQLRALVMGGAASSLRSRSGRRAVRRTSAETPVVTADEMVADAVPAPSRTPDDRGPVGLGHAPRPARQRKKKRR